MKKNIIEGPWILGIGTALILAGCATTHYKVTDPQSGSTYFTEELQNLSGGTVKLKDARSGSTVTLQNSEVKEISAEAYKEGLAAPATTPGSATTPAPAATPTPTPTPATPAPAAPTAPTPEAAPTPTPK